MKLFDVNVTIGGRDCQNKLINLDYIYSFLETYHVDKVICRHHYALLDPKEGNRRMAEIAKKSNGKIDFCAVLDPILSADNLCGEGTLEEKLLRDNAKCIHIFPKSARVPFVPFYWEEILDVANKLKLPLFIGFDYTETFWRDLPKIASAYSDIKFILYHVGTCNSRAIMPILEKLDNVYFTIEYMLDNLQIEEIDQKFGCDNLLFGSNFPNRPIEGALGLAIYANISELSREKIFFKNWEAITK